jgi:hypothetical protein
MRECIKIMLGVLALTIGASAPTLILEALRPGSLVALNPPSPGGRNTQHQSEAQSSKHHGDAQGAYDGSTNAPIIAQAQPPDQHAVAANPKEEGEWYAKPDWWVAGFTAALFIATTGLWIFTALLWLSTRRAVLEGAQAIKAAQCTAAAANTHARAAQEANRINREALVATNRPWIRIDMDVVKGEPVIITSEHIEAAVQIKVTNIGRSPATEVSFKIEFFPDLVAANRRVSNMNIQEIEGAAARYGQILFPEQHFCEKRWIRTSVAEFVAVVREAAAFATDADSADANENETFREGWPAAIAVVWYRIPVSAEPRHTVIVGQIKNTALGKIGFDGSEGEFTTVAMIESPMGNRAT